MERKEGNGNGRMRLPSFGQQLRMRGNVADGISSNFVNKSSSNGKILEGKFTACLFPSLLFFFIRYSNTLNIFLSDTMML